MPYGEMVMLTKDQILEAEDIKTKEVDLTKEWGGKVLISSMFAERHLIFEDMSQGRDKNQALAYYAASVIINEDGSPMFSDISDLEKLNKKSSVALMKVLDAGLSLNGVSTEDIETNAKNS